MDIMQWNVNGVRTLLPDLKALVSHRMKKSPTTSEITFLVYLFQRW
jgi:exonuclease III